MLCLGRISPTTPRGDRTDWLIPLFIGDVCFGKRIRVHRLPGAPRSKQLRITWCCITDTPLARPITIWQGQHMWIATTQTRGHQQTFAPHVVYRPAHVKEFIWKEPQVLNGWSKCRHKCRAVSGASNTMNVVRSHWSNAVCSSCAAWRRLFNDLRMFFTFRFFFFGWSIAVKNNLIGAVRTFKNLRFRYFFFLDFC